MESQLINKTKIENEEFDLSSIQDMINDKINLDLLRFSVCCSDSTASL